MLTSLFGDLGPNKDPDGKKTKTSSDGTDVPVFEDVDELRWSGPTERFRALAAEWDAAKAL